MTLRPLSASGQLLAAASCMVSAFACATPSPEAGAVEPPARDESGERVVAGRFEGEFDGDGFTIRPAPADATQGLLPAPGGTSEIGTVQQDLLTVQPSEQFGSAVDSTDSNLVALEQIGLVRKETAWDTTSCGPTPAKGSCATIQIRNMFGAYDLSHAYFYLDTLAPVVAGCTVGIAAVDTATVDGDLVGTHGTEVVNGLWRYGLVERATPSARVNSRNWVFTGTATKKFSFRFTGNVLASLQRPTVRVSLANGSSDTATAPDTYALGAASSGVDGTSIDATSDGTYVVFSSTDTSLGANAHKAHMIYRRNTSTGVTTTMSVQSDGSPAENGNCDAKNPSVSSDGTKVVFESTNCNLGFGTTSGKNRNHVYLRDTTNGRTILVSHSTSGQAEYEAGNSYSPRISADGKYVTFVSTSTDVVASYGGSSSRRYLYRATITYGSTPTSTVTTVATRLVGTTPAILWQNADMRNADISGDGRYIVADTAATDMGAGETSGNDDVYLFDMNASHRTSLVSTKSDGSHYSDGSSGCNLPSISADGSKVAFLCVAHTPADRLVAAPAATVDRRHVYQRSPTSASSLEMVDKDPTGTVEAGSSASTFGVSLSADGKLTAYVSGAGNILRTSGCAPSCETFSEPQGFVHDSAAADPEVKRSFLATQIRSAAGIASPYTPSSVAMGTGTTSLSRSIRVVGTRDNAFLFYSAAAAAFADLTSSARQVYVSPVGDARFQ